MMPHLYETDGAAIYRQSFATIRAEADLARFTADEEPVVVRMIHAAGMVGLERHVRFTPGMARLARAALREIPKPPLDFVESDPYPRLAAVWKLKPSTTGA